MADIFNVDDQDNYDVQEFDHEPSEQDYIASLEEIDVDFYDKMSRDNWIPDQVRKTEAGIGVLDFGKLQEQINIDRNQLEMWGQQSKTNATNPSHYNQVPAHLQHWDVVGQMGWDYHVGCATKYIWRAGKKSSASLTDNEKEIEDLRKAVVYLEKKIELLGE